MVGPAGEAEAPLIGRQHLPAAVLRVPDQAEQPGILVRGPLLELGDLGSEGEGEQLRPVPDDLVDQRGRLGRIEQTKPPPPFRHHGDPAQLLLPLRRDQHAPGALPAVELGAVRPAREHGDLLQPVHGHGQHHRPGRARVVDLHRLPAPGGPLRPFPHRDLPLQRQCRHQVATGTTPRTSQPRDTAAARTDMAGI